MQPNTDSPVLVTGASGYIASHLIKILLERGFKVRGSVRSVSNQAKYQFLYDLVPEKKDNLTLVEAELTDKESWLKAVEGCQYIFHVASPIPPSVPKDETELIIPAVEGTLNVLEAAVQKGVKKVVVTSSCLTVMIGQPDGKLNNEEDWSSEECPAYPKSKIKAEKAAWKFYEENKGRIEVTTVLPSLVFGPIYTKHGNSSETLIAEIIRGNYPGVLDISFAIVDVRDVAEAHFNAMFKEGTNGKRYIASGALVPFEDVFKSLKGDLEQYGYKINDKHVTAEEVVASGNPVAQRSVNLIGKKMLVNNERSKTELGMKYIPIDQTVKEMAHSLIKQGVVENKLPQ